jgi:dihydrofolate reductase
MQVTIDGYVAGLQGQLDWMTLNIDEQLLALINRLADTSDTILLGRKMTPEFVRYWDGVVSKSDSRWYNVAQHIVRTPKVVFSKTLQRVDGQNVRVENGELRQAVDRLKRHAGKDIIVYGGVSFVSSLIQHDLIDEFNLFIYPTSLGDGLRIFHDRKPLTLQTSSAYPCGIVVNTYVKN